MPLNTDALTTVANARSFIGDSAADQTLLEILINGYSRAIRRYTGRQFKPAEVAVAKKFRYDGSGILDLDGTELKGAPTSIVFGSDLPAAYRVTLAAADADSEADYRLEPANATLEGTYLWIVLLTRETPQVVSDSGYNARADLKEFEVSITGNWGADIVPADVETACLIAVTNGYRNPEALAQRSLGALSLSEVVEPPDQPGRSLPPDARALLAPYRRPVLA